MPTKAPNTTKGEYTSKHNKLSDIRRKVDALRPVPVDIRQTPTDYSSALRGEPISRTGRLVDGNVQVEPEFEGIRFVGSKIVDAPTAHTRPRGSAAAKKATKQTTCGAKTAAGKACQNSPRSGSKYCGSHKGYRA